MKYQSEDILEKPGNLYYFPMSICLVTEAHGFYALQVSFDGHTIACGPSELSLRQCPTSF